MLNATMMNIAERIGAYYDWDISRDQALALIPNNAEQIMDLLSYANKIRHCFKQQRIFKCGIVNAKSGMCSEDCAFCAQSAHHGSNVDVYPLRSSAELIESGFQLARAGATHYSIVTSGTALNASKSTPSAGRLKSLRKKAISACAPPWVCCRSRTPANCGRQGSRVITTT